MVRLNVSLMFRYEAVKVTGVGADTLPAVTLNTVEVAPGGIVTVGGMIAAGEDERSMIVAPGANAGAVSATWQLEALGGVIKIGVHVNPFKAGVCMMVTIPALAEVANDAAIGSAALASENWTADDVLVVELDKVRETFATTPFEIGVAFRPHRTQCEVPGMLLQEIDLLAVVATGPAVTLADEKSAGEYTRVHSIAAAGSEPMALSDVFSVTTDPGLPEPEDKANTIPD
jgi:hypothetical protein